ncbi:vancomycin resistance vanw [Lucifera butyrica]|uniref:Vancomycin resistance vanw n=1 Tax=Lucifera butyrica TaxID=1351585 RepID=A0A498R671_9FIRM|nr:VanW family protein [Lucifera butyrica]VBB06360.1 vancomycin resistance vanw [Lucifera butyrica]
MKEKAAFLRHVILWLTVILVLTGTGCLRKPAPKPDMPRVAHGVMLDGLAVGNMTGQELTGLVTALESQENRSPVNARFDDLTGDILPGNTGRAINAGATVERVMAAAAGSLVQVQYRILWPEITENKLRQARLIGRYRSPLLDSTPARVQNILQTTRLVNNTVLPVENEFSFNRTTGEPTLARGFQKAAVFAADGQTVQEVGGGMCQVSSTLYCAVRQAGLPVTERHPHSRPVAYVPPGYDATTYTDKNFRFVNARRHPLIIRAWTDNRQVTVDLWELML